jgi:hypothetical protein
MNRLLLLAKLKAFAIFIVKGFGYGDGYNVFDVWQGWILIPW